jgi:hypothetical protein
MTVVSTNYAFYARGLDHAGALRRINRLCQQLFNASFAQPIAPACQARWVDWWFRLQVSLTGEHLGS